jgi:23S rRNA-/tRNA-specific pseudouridylate synthase
MKRFKRHCKSFYKNVIVKKKFKSYIQSFIDSEYRRQLNELYALTHDKVKTERRFVNVERIVHGHKVIYPEYEQMLLNNDSIPIAPIRVVQKDETYLVVDGNHRLAAVKARARKTASCVVICEVHV